jgi:hypothetical protein
VGTGSALSECANHLKREPFIAARAIPPERRLLSRADPKEGDGRGLENRCMNKNLVR